MTKRDIPAPAVSNRHNNSVKLVTCQDSEHRHYVEPSITCAAQHAINICDNEAGCAQSIEQNGKIIWQFDPAHPRKSLAELDELAQGECVR